MSTAFASSDTQQQQRSVAAIRRVSVSPATATQPPFIRAYFRDVAAAHQGFSMLPEKLAKDARTALNLDAPMPTLTYPVV